MELTRITNAPLKTEPFTHFFLENVFSDTTYQALIDNLPDTFYYQKSKNYARRYTLPLNQDTLELLDPKLQEFWSPLTRVMQSKQFLSAVLHKFQVELSDDFSPILQLVQDHDHYALGPHTDIPNKVVTLLFYLPPTNDQAHLGTSLYRPLDPQFRCSGHAHHPFEQFVKVGQVPFLANSVFGFIRTDVSFHGVEPIGVQEIQRNILSYSVWKSRKS